MTGDYVIASYLRISNEDDEVTGNAHNESVSITGQRGIIRDFLNRHSELKNRTVIEFADDGYSGTNFNRPGVSAMLQKAKRGEIQCIIVKDFSRFGRNYLEVGNYLEQIFPFLEIRFISVNDGFDSNAGYSAVGTLDISFKNLIHDLYSKDISQKIISTRRFKAKQGKFIAGYAPYGFMKTNKQRLIADYESASVVKRIYQMFLNGVSQAEIARYLNSEKIPSPLMLRRLRNEPFPCNQINEECYWTASSVHRILNDRRYTGDGVYGRAKPSSVGSSKSVSVPKEKWIIVPNSHEVIIPRESFEKAQSKHSARDFNKISDKVPLSGKVHCASCNHIIPRYSHGNRNVEKARYRCATKRNTERYSCFEKSIAEQDLENAVLVILKKFVSLIDQTAFTGQSRKYGEGYSIALIRQISKLQKSLDQLRLSKLTAYEAYKAQRITIDAYKRSKEKTDQEFGLTEKKINHLEYELKDKSRPTVSSEHNCECLKCFSPFERLTRKITDALIDTVYLNNDGSLSIIWAFKDPFAGQ